MRRIAFDLDETLGVPRIERGGIVGWQMRTGCAELLDRLRVDFELVLWSVSPRRYVDKALASGLGEWFRESYSWDEIASPWKDVRRIRADVLVDDSPHHRASAERYQLESRYVVVPVNGCPEDTADPLAWVRLVDSGIARIEPSHRIGQVA